MNTIANFLANHKTPNCARIEIEYNKLTETNKLYTDRANYSLHTMAWLTKQFGVTYSSILNDAPRGGKRGNYILLVQTPAWVEFCRQYKSVVSEDEAVKAAIKAEREAKIDALVISDQCKQYFIDKVAGLSRKQARKVACNMAANKLGFYSTEGTHKFMSLLA